MKQSLTKKEKELMAIVKNEWLDNFFNPKPINENEIIID